MKKLIAVSLTLAMLLGLTSCGMEQSASTQTDASVSTPDVGASASTPSGSADTSSPIENDTSDSVEALTLGQEYSVPDYADFTIEKIITSKKIEASMDSQTYYENPTSGETYIDIVLKLTNTSTVSISSEDALTASVTTSNGHKYSASLFAIETNDNTRMSRYENIAPLSTAMLHCAISVPENAGELTLQLTMNGSNFTCPYTMSSQLVEKEPLTIGQPIEAPDYATLQLQNVVYTDELLPSDTSSTYTYYEVDNTSSTYLAVYFNITNLQNTAKDADSFVSVKAVYQDKYTYTGFVVTEDTDGRGFRSYADLDPLTERTVILLIEVPKTVTDNPAELDIRFNGTNYSYTFAG